MKRSLLLTLPLLFLTACFKHIPEKRDYLDFASMWNPGEPQARYLQEMGRLFQEQGGMEVRFTFYGRDVLTKIRSRVLMQDVPDLVDQDFSELSAAFIDSRSSLVEPLDNLFLRTPGPEEQQRLMDIFPPGVLELYRIKGSLHFFPYIFNTSGFFYNEELFEQLGLGPPGNWDSFQTVQSALADSGISAMALDGSISFYNAYYYYWFVTVQAGADMLLKAVEDESGEIWNHPVFLNAARQTAELGRESWFQAGFAGSVFPAAQNRWAEGGIGTILCGSWIPAETQRLRNFSAGFFPFPAFGNAPASTAEAYLIGAAVPKGARHSIEARKFLLFLMRKDNCLKLVEMTGNMSVRRDLNYPPQLAPVNEYLNAAPGFHAPYGGVWFRHPEWFQKHFLPLSDMLIFGRISPEEFIREMSRRTVVYSREQ